MRARECLLAHAKISVIFAAGLELKLWRLLVRENVVDPKQQESSNKGHRVW